MAKSPQAMNGAQDGATSLDSDIDQVFGTFDVATSGDEAGDADDGADDSAPQLVTQDKQEDGESDAGEFDGLAEPLGAKPERGPNGETLDRNGRVIATTREERQNLYNFNRLRVAADKIKSHNLTLEKELNQLRALKDMPGRLGLSLDQVSEAMDFRARIERDPVTTIRDIVAKTLANGYTMEQLFGGEAAGYINGQMIGQQLDSRLAPLTQRHAAEQRETQISDAARASMDRFVQEHEYAELHGEAIARTVANVEGMSPERAYHELEKFAIRNGLDFTQPLAPQIEARERENAGGQKQPLRQNGAPSTPGHRRPAANGAQPAKANAYAPADADFRSIVQQAMFDLSNPQ